MAAKLEPRIASLFLDVLNSLQCPYTEDVDDSYIGELLLSPGEHRIRLLLWIFGKIHPDLDKMMNLPKVLVAAPAALCIDKRIQILTGLAAAFGLCKTADFDVVRGHAPTLKQISFWKKLFSLAEHFDSPHLNQAFEADNVLQNEVTMPTTKGEILNLGFSSRSGLLPHDLAVEFSRTKHSQKRVTRESFNDVKGQLVKLAEALSTQENILTDLEKKLKYLEKDDKVACDNISRVLSLTLNDLDQMLTTFDQVFENSYAPFCNREPLSFGSLGQVIRVVQKQLSYVMDTFDNLESIKASTNAVLECTDRWSKTRKRVVKLVAEFDDFWSGSLQCFDNLNRSTKAMQGLDSQSIPESSTVGKGFDSKIGKSILDISVVK